MQRDALERLSKAELIELMLLAPAPEAAGWPVGHVALADAAPGEMANFYAEAIGFTLHERLATKLGPLTLDGGFVGTAARHHALAVLNVPGRRRLIHIMFEAPSVAEVARLYDQAEQAGVPISLGLGLGQHPLPFPARLVVSLPFRRGSAGAGPAS
jgi:catechol 2,3-dioxygenase-like lactoylglutathione lyase family enzyme